VSYQEGFVKVHSLQRRQEPDGPVSPHGLVPGDESVQVRHSRQQSQDEESQNDASFSQSAA